MTQQDTGYAWLILVASMLINFLTIGFLYGAVGVLTAEYSHVFGIDTSTSSWIGSTLTGLVLFSGPLAAFLIGKFGCRVIAVVSVSLHIIAFLISAFATQWWHVIPSFAVICGIACCCSHIATMKMLTIYFDKYQHAAYAAGAVGSDIAAVAFPFVTRSILDALPYRDAMLAITAILLHALPCAILFKGKMGKISVVRRSGIGEIQPSKDTSVTDESAAFGDKNLHCTTTETVKTSSVDLICPTNPMLTLCALENRNICSGIKEVATDAQDLCNGSVLQEEMLSLEPMHDDTQEHCAAVVGHEKHRLSDHLKLLKKPVIFVFLLNCFLWNMGGAIMSVLAYSYYLDCGLSHSSASLGMTLCGVGSFCGSLTLTVISMKFPINRLNLHIVCNFILAATLAIFSVVPDEISMTVVLTVFGCSLGTICANLGSLVEHLNGSRLLYLVYGYEMAFAGVGSFMGPVIGASLQNSYGFLSTFLYGAATCFLGLILFILYVAIKQDVRMHYSLRHIKNEQITACELSTERPMSSQMSLAAKM